MKEFENKTALVTGASRGIGAAAAIALAQAGVKRVVAHYGSHRKGAEETAAAVRAADAEADVIGGELGSSPGIEQFLAELKRAAPKIDILVNNAGSLVKRARLPEYTPELFDTVMALNVKSVYFLAQAVAPHMVEQNSGVIINLSSIAARNGGGPGATIYSAAKAAVTAITKGLAKELAPKGIRVNAVSPGTVDNHFHEVFSTREVLNNVIAQTPAGRLGTNEEIADAIVFLCSDAARYIHGQTIEINGGMLMV
ncbi:MAG TPA: glucose 1-dehydrogenase [Bryobacteraceae bacterium]|nr:glucose 1-dehydrogenase [Bryobacteraceae bacterium]